MRSLLPQHPGGTRRLMAALLCLFALAGCGKKGPPLPPFSRIPSPVTNLTATRLGDEVYVSMVVPRTNIDDSMPVDIERIDVYAYTGTTPPPPGRFAEFGTIVASIPVFAPPRVDPDDPAPSPPPVPPTHAAPGATATVRDALTAEAFVQGPVAPEVLRLPAPSAAAAGPLPPPVLRRYYQAIPFNTRGVPGPPSTAELVLVTAPDPPQRLRATYTESAVQLQWDPPGGLLGFLLDRVIPAEAPPFDVLGPPGTPPPDMSVPPGPTSFNVYKEVAGDPLAPLPVATAQTPATWGQPVPAASPAGAALTLSDPVTPLDFGRLRCYTVRAVRGTVLSPASAPYCFTLVDVFPPPAPTGLAAIASDAGVSLIWDPSPVADLGGYLVLRREAGDATLRLLTETPVPDARFVDTTATAGTRYVYTVVAVDQRLPLPNLSPESLPIEETAR